MNLKQLFALAARSDDPKGRNLDVVAVETAVSQTFDVLAEQSPAEQTAILAKLQAKAEARRRKA